MGASDPEQQDPRNDILRINDEVHIPLAELRFRYALSSGPGGQNVNRTATKVELLFDVLNSPSISAEQRFRILARLKRAIDRQGVVHLTSQSTRSQLRNRQEVTARFALLLAESVRAPRARVATRPPRGAQERRLRHKRAHSLRKEQRLGPRPDEEEA